MNRFQVVAKHSETQCSCDIVLNDTIVELLQYVPCHMKELSLVDRYKETLSFIINSFGYLLQKNIPYNNKEFAKVIKEHYCLSNPRTKYVYEFLMNI